MTLTLTARHEVTLYGWRELNECSWGIVKRVVTKNDVYDYDEDSGEANLKHWVVEKTDSERWFRTFMDAKREQRRILKDMRRWTLTALADLSKQRKDTCDVE